MDYFKVICPEDENTRRVAWVNFYIYHETERRITTTALLAPGDTTATQKQVTVEIEPRNLKQQYKVKFTDMLKRYGVTWDDTTILDVLVQDFWDKFFDPDDPWEGQYCHSPWFDGCCKEQKTIGALKGEFDKVCFKMEPKQTRNYAFDKNKGILQPDVLKSPPTQQNPATPTALEPYGFELPHNIEVVHYDFNTLGIQLLAPPVYPDFLVNGENPLINPNELKVMLILCC